MRIGCIGWGSLLWDPRTLPMRGSFHDDGPRLPIEFSRVSLDGRVTLVVDPSAAPITTYWCELAVSGLGEAVEALGMREKIEPARRADWIGRLTQAGQSAPTGRDVTAPNEATSSDVVGTIRDWLAERPFDAIVWTALPPRDPTGRFGWPTDAELLAHLAGLEGSARDRAEQYIRRAPAQTSTVRRSRFERALGWTAEQD